MKAYKPEPQGWVVAETPAELFWFISERVDRLRFDLEALNGDLTTAALTEAEKVAEHLDNVLRDAATELCIPVTPSSHGDD